MPIYLGIFSDTHYNSPACDKDKFHKFISEIKRKKGYLLGLGDYLDSVSSSERKALRMMELHDGTTETIEDTYMQDIDDFVQAIKPLQDRVIGLGGGNHYYQFTSGISSDQLLCLKLRCKYLGVNSIIRLLLRLNKTHALKVDICIHHGRGGGAKRVGTSLNHLQDMATFFDADIILQGHDHDRKVDYINRLGLSSNNILQNRKILLARTGSFLRSYEEGRSSYAVDAGYPPSDLGGVLVRLTPCREHRKFGTPKRIDKYWVDIEATI